MIFRCRRIGWRGWGRFGSVAGPPFFVVMETVKAAKSVIEGELAKFGTWEDYLSSAYRGQLTIENAQTFTNLKEKGVGIGTIHIFLGKQWSRYLIENTLSVIRQEETAARTKAEAYEAAQRAKEEREKRPG